MDKIIYKCGHLHNGEFLGRGKLRAQRIATIKTFNCPACIKRDLIDRAHKLTHIDGTLYTETEVQIYLKNHNLI